MAFWLSFGANTHWNNLVGYRLFACLTAAGVPANQGGIELLFAGGVRPLATIAGTLTIADSGNFGQGFQDRKIDLYGLTMDYFDGAHSEQEYPGVNGPLFQPRSLQLVRLVWAGGVGAIAANGQLPIRYDEQNLPPIQGAAPGQLGYFFAEFPNAAANPIAAAGLGNTVPPILDIPAAGAKPLLRVRNSVGPVSLGRNGSLTLVAKRQQGWSWPTILLRQCATPNYGMTVSVQQHGYQFNWGPANPAAYVLVEELFGAFAQVALDIDAVDRNDVPAWCRTDVSELPEDWQIVNGGTGGQGIAFGGETLERITFVR